jgi:hypothetical protein
MTDPKEKWRQNHRDLQARLLQTGVLDEQALLTFTGTSVPAPPQPGCSNRAAASSSLTRLMALATRRSSSRQPVRCGRNWHPTSPRFSTQASTPR